MDQATRFADAYPPREIARMVERLGVAKAQTDTITLSALSAPASTASADSADNVMVSVCALATPRRSTCLLYTSDAADEL